MGAGPIAKIALSWLLFRNVGRKWVLLSLYRYCFPFGRPEGALKATLSLLERVCTT